MAHKANPNSLANLTPPWTSDTAPRRYGAGNRPGGVVYPAEHLRTTLADATRQDLERLRDDLTTPANLLAAVHLLLDATDGSGASRDRVHAASELMDRQTGKTTVQVRVAQDVPEDPGALLARICARLRGDQVPPHATSSPRSPFEVRPSSDGSGLVSEEGNIADEMGFSSTHGKVHDTQIVITDDLHYITQPFALGLLTVATTNSRQEYPSGTLAGAMWRHRSASELIMISRAMHIPYK